MGFYKCIWSLPVTSKAFKNMLPYGTYEAELVTDTEIVEISRNTK